MVYNYVCIRVLSGDCFVGWCGVGAITRESIEILFSLGGGGEHNTVLSPPPLPI